MKRILLTVHKFFPKHRAGTEVLTLKVAQELQRRGYEVLVVAANPPDLDARHADGKRTSDYVYEGVPVHIVEEALRLEDYTFEHEYYHPGLKEHFTQLLDRFNPDLLHIFHAQNLSASIVEAANDRNLPVVFSATDFWFVCPIVQLKKPDGKVCRGPVTLAANCLTCYTPQLFAPKAEFEEALRSRFAVLNETYKHCSTPVQMAATEVIFKAYSMTKLWSAMTATIQRPQFLTHLANTMSKIMVPTQLMREIFIENGITPELLKLVPFGLDTEQLTPYDQKTVSEELRVGYIGTISEHKGVDLLVQAFRGLPAGSKVRLTIYGDMEQFPEYAQHLVELAQRKGTNCTKIEFAGTFPNSQLGKVLQDLDVLVVPSRWYENTPLVIQSALATKTPVIATNLGGMSEIIKDRVNGLLFELNNMGSLREQLLSLLNHPELLMQLRCQIEPERTTAQMVDDIEAVYSEVLGKKLVNISCA